MQTGKIRTQDVDRALQQSLAALGFKKSSPGTCCRPISTDALGWVGFNGARPGDGSLEVAPMIGVHCVPVHKLIAEMRREKYKSCNPPTFARNAGYLMPHRDTFIAIRLEEPAHIVERLPLFVEIVRDVGLPFMQQHADVASTLDALKRFGSLQEYEERVCAAEYLLGNHQAAREMAERHLHKLQGEHVVLRERFEKFSKPFLDSLSGR